MTAAVPGSGFIIVAGDRLGDRLVQPLDVVDQSHIAFDELAAGGDVVRSE